MEVIKKYIKSRGLFVVLVLLLGFFSAEMRAMWMSAAQKKAYVARQLARKQQMEQPLQQQEVRPIKSSEEIRREQEEAFMPDTDYAIAQKVKTLRPGQYFVYAKGTADGIVVPWDVLQNSQVLKVMIEDLGGQQGKIALSLPFSFNTIKHVMYILVFFNELYDTTESAYTYCFDKKYSKDPKYFDKYIQLFEKNRYYNFEARKRLHKFVRDEYRKNATIDELVQEINCIDYLDIPFLTTFSSNEEEDPMSIRKSIRLGDEYCYALYRTSLTEPYEYMIANFVKKILTQILDIQDCYKRSQNRCKYEYPKNYESLRNLNFDIVKKIIKKIYIPRFSFYENKHESNQFLINLIPNEKEFFIDKHKNLAEDIDFLILQLKNYIESEQSEASKWFWQRKRWF
jgi:hypothetical protein